MGLPVLSWPLELIECGESVGVFSLVTFDKTLEWTAGSSGLPNKMLLPETVYINKYLNKIYDSL